MADGSSMSILLYTFRIFNLLVSRHLHHETVSNLGTSHVTQLLLGWGPGDLIYVTAAGWTPGNLRKNIPDKSQSSNAVD